MPKKKRRGKWIAFFLFLSAVLFVCGSFIVWQGVERSGFVSYSTDQKIDDETMIAKIQKQIEQWIEQLEDYLIEFYKSDQEKKRDLTGARFIRVNYYRVANL